VAHQKLVIPAILKFETTPCTWSLGRSSRLTYEKRTTPARGEHRDPWQVRSDFLRLDSDTDEILKFLNHTGLFYSGEAIHPVTIQAVQEWRTLLRKLMLEADFSQWDRLLCGFRSRKSKAYSWNPNSLCASTGARSPLRFF
jgi:hypothetical protein